MNVSYRYLNPNQKIYIISKLDRNFPSNFGSKRYYTVPYKEKNVIIGFLEPNLCDKAMESLQFQRLEKVEVDVKYLMNLSDTLKMESIVLMKEIEEETKTIDLFYYKKK